MYVFGTCLLYQKVTGIFLEICVWKEKVKKKNVTIAPSLPYFLVISYFAEMLTVFLCKNNIIKGLINYSKLSGCKSNIGYCTRQVILAYTQTFHCSVVSEWYVCALLCMSSVYMCMHVWLYGLIPTTHGGSSNNHSFCLRNSNVSGKRWDLKL